MARSTVQDPAHGNDAASAEAALLETILFAIGTAEDYHGAIGATLRAICEATAWCAGQAWVAHESGGFLVALPVFHCQADSFHRFRAADGAVTAALDAGLAGRASAAGRALWSTDLSELGPERRDAARLSGLVAAFAFPIPSDERPSTSLAVLEFFSDCTRPTDAALVEAVERVVSRLGPLLRRKRGEQALRESAARYRSVIEGAPFGFMRTTIAGRIVDANSRLAIMLGYESIEDLKRLDPGSDVYIDPQDRARDLEVSSGSPLATGIERRWKKKDGAAMTVRLKGRAVLDMGTGSVEFETLVEDVTEVVELEQQLRLAQKMEAVGRLAGGIAHDFNNMLMAISGYAEILLHDLEPGDRRRDDVAEISRAADRAAALTRQLLAFSRHQPIAATRLDLSLLVANMEKMLRRLIGEDVELVTVAPSRPLWIMADAGQIAQVLMNLVVNARDAIPANGRVTIEVAAWTITAAAARRLPDVRPGRYVTLSVTDNGGGMTAEVKSRMFEPFFTTKEPGKGTGLGLSTVYGIVKQAGGHIGVDTEVGRGSCFTIYLPDAEMAAPAMDIARRPATTTFGTETVLVVEDEPSVRALVRAVLSRAGYRVLEAADGECALALARAHEGAIDLLLTDVVMPKMNGRDLAVAMQRVRPKTKVVFMSGYASRATGGDPIDQPPAIGPGDNYIQKPFVAETLSRKVREILDAGQ
jgi:two-component system, cell cycle sensor histidine kinase and response regulator CckA